MPDTAPVKLVTTGSKKFRLKSMTSPLSSNAKQFKSPWKFRGLTFAQLGQVCGDVFKEIIANNLFERAAALAFHFVFALFPLILLMVNLLGCSPRTESNFKMIFCLTSQIFFPRRRFNFCKRWLPS